MSDFFKDMKSDEEKVLIPPDYDHPEEEDEEDLDETITPDEEDEIITRESINEKLESENKVEKKEIKSMSSPFGSPTGGSVPWSVGSSSPSWTQPSSGGFGGSGGFGSSSSPFFGTQPKSFGSFSGGPSWGSSSSASQKEVINRDKKVLFIPFLDGLVAPYGADRPGLAPRDIYDLCPRFEVWNKLASFNPQRVYVISPLNILNSANGACNVGEVTLTYFCYSLSAYLRAPIDRCQVIVPSMIGQPTELVIGEVLAEKYSSIKKSDCIYIGVYSGFGTSNTDSKAAEICGIDYIDINQLLNNTI